MKYLQSCVLPLLYLAPVHADYTDDAIAAIKTLNDKWYDAATGIWNAHWWQSGNMAETIARFGHQEPSFKQAAIDILSNTYEKSPNLQGSTNWKNHYYDDMGWWAMAWIATYDLTADSKYLNTAKDIFEEMTGGWTTPCGGIWWSKDKVYITAVSNELFLSIGAHLANRVNVQEKEHYLHWAQMEWDWFWNSGIINKEGNLGQGPGIINKKGLINDGVNKTTCENDRKNTWTYNQGIVLGGLSELARAKGDGGYIKHAQEIADATIATLSKDGILNENLDGNLGITVAMFKGAFVRNLAILNANKPEQRYTDFLMKNAESAWKQEKVNGTVIGDRWQGGERFANDVSHASGIDVLVAAARFQK